MLFVCISVHGLVSTYVCTSHVRFNVHYAKFSGNVEDAVPCHRGTYAIDGMLTCEICPRGYQCYGGDLDSHDSNNSDATMGITGAQAISPCPLGTYCEEGSYEAMRCEPGFVCSTPGTREQQPCPAGHYCSENSTVATPCSAGTYAPHDQSESCMACPPLLGQYCEEGCFLPHQDTIICKNKRSSCCGME